MHTQYCLLIDLVFALLVLVSSIEARPSTSLWTSWAPLAVRSPYLNAWLNMTNVPPNASAHRAPMLMPTYWNEATLGWLGLIRVDNSTIYPWLGPMNTSATGWEPTTLTNIQITPTQTVMNITAGPLDLTVTYLSPIEPADLVKQSFPLTYILLSMTSNDGRAHHVQVYSDITGEWLAGDRAATITWDWNIDNSNVNLIASLHNPRTLSEANNQAMDATVYFGSLRRNPERTFQLDLATSCRWAFQTNGTLDVGMIEDSDGFISTEGAISISTDLGDVGSAAVSTFWILGMGRDPAIQTLTTSGATEVRSPYWRAANDALTLIPQLIADFNTTLERAQAFDAALLSNASQISPEFADLVSLAARQAMAGVEITVGGVASGYNRSDVKMFMREVGAPNGRVNPVEVMYAAFPFYLTMNASYGGWLLAPVLDYANSPVWNQAFAPADIGTSYPNATGTSPDPEQGVEQSGNMLIMALAYFQASGDFGFISTYYLLLKRWTDYLVENTWPLKGEFRTTDSKSPSNSTNLSIKGIIAIGAMSQLSNATSNQGDSVYYSKIAQSYAAAWAALALAPDGHVISSFEEAQTSWALQYNLFADRWLKTNLISTSIYTSESAFISRLLPSYTNGIPNFSDDDSYGNIAWTMLTAASMADPAVRDALINPIWQMVSSNASGTILSTAYGLSAQNAYGMSGSPGIGAVFAPLALSGTINTSNPAPSTTPSSVSGPSKHRSHAGTIAGASVGAAAGVLLCVALGFVFWRRAHRQDDQCVYEGDEPRFLTEPVPYDYTLHNPPLQGPQGLGSKSRPAAHIEPTAADADPVAAPEIIAEPSNGSEPEVAHGVQRQSRGEEDVHGLRQEFENLRQMIQRLEPPPTYHSGE